MRHASRPRKCHSRRGAACTRTTPVCQGRAPNEFGSSRHCRVWSGDWSLQHGVEEASSKRFSGWVRAEIMTDGRGRRTHVCFCAQLGRHVSEAPAKAATLGRGLEHVQVRKTQVPAGRLTLRTKERVASPRRCVWSRCLSASTHDVLLIGVVASMHSCMVASWVMCIVA